MAGKPAKRFEWEVIAKAMRTLKEQNRHRELMLVAVATFTAYRCCDWSKLKWENFFFGNIQNNKVLTQSSTVKESKTSKKRSVYIGEDFAEILRFCLEGMKPTSLFNFIFKAQNGRRVRGITTDGVNFILRKIIADGILPEGCTSHSFRKTFAYKVFMDMGGDFRALLHVKKMLNHSTVEMTIIYLGLEEDAIASAQNNLRVL